MTQHYLAKFRVPVEGNDPQGAAEQALQQLRTQSRGRLEVDVAWRRDDSIPVEITVEVACELPEAERRARGQLLADVLGLRRDKDHKDRYLTDWGSKTALGVYETIKRIVEEGKQ